LKLRDFVTSPYAVYQPLAEFTKYDDWIPHDTRFSDDAVVTIEVGRYQPNAWGLHDMHGNVAEWTRSQYRPYPYDAADSREDDSPEGLKVVRGGSWRDGPDDCRSASRWRYPAWQRVYNVGFRVAAKQPATRRVD
jgi:formylglycine-generating enzyme required for sulfatase activity